MLLVPKQLKRVGMTGNIPWYGGRFTPQQAYATSHPARSAPSPTATDRPQVSIEALEQLRAAGVLTEAEYDQFRARVEP